MNIPLSLNTRSVTAPVPAQVSVVSADASTLSSDDVSNAVKDKVLAYRVQQMIQQDEAKQIITSVDIVDLQANNTLLDYNGETAQFAASVNKLAVAWLTLQDLRTGKFQITDVIAWKPDDVRAGYGLYDQPGAPTTATIQDVIQDMLNRSGNTAVRILVNYELGGAAAVNNRLGQYPEIPETRLQPLDASHFYLGNSTSNESLWIMEQLVQTKDTYEQFMQHAMATNIFNYYGVRSQLEGNDYIVLVNKVGILDDPTGNNRHDVGIIYNTRTHKSYGYSFMTTSPAADPLATPQAEYSLEQMGRDTLRYAGDKPQTRPRTGPHAESLAPSPQTAPSYQPEQKIVY